MPTFTSSEVKDTVPVKCWWTSFHQCQAPWAIIRDGQRLVVQEHLEESLLATTVLHKIVCYGALSVSGLADWGGGVCQRIIL